MVEYGEVEKFGTLLLVKRSGRPRSHFAKDCKVDENTIIAWERASSFPKEEKLESISIVYEISMEELREVLEISKSARQREIGGRKPARAGRMNHPFHNELLFAGAIMSPCRRYSRR